MLWSVVRVWSATERPSDGSNPYSSKDVAGSSVFQRMVARSAPRPVTWTSLITGGVQSDTVTVAAARRGWPRPSSPSWYWTSRTFPSAAVSAPALGTGDSASCPTNTALAGVDSVSATGVAPAATPPLTSTLTVPGEVVSESAFESDTLIVIVWRHPGA